MTEELNNVVVPSGGIFIDEESDEESDDSTSILDITAEQRTAAKAKLDSGEMLFPEQEKDLKELVRVPKVQREQKTHFAYEFDENTITDFDDFVGAFDLQLATKKQFRAFRKLLSKMCNLRYPRVKRVKKTKVS